MSEENGGNYPSRLWNHFLEAFHDLVRLGFLKVSENSGHDDNQGKCYKTFYGRNIRMLVISLSVCPWQSFPAKSNACWKSKSPTDWSIFHIFQFRIGTLPYSDIRLGWEGLPGTNTLAYYWHLWVTTIKSFITLGPGWGRSRGRSYRDWAGQIPML